MTDKTQRTQAMNDLEKRLKELEDMSVETVNALADKKINGASINIADIYFVLSKALQQVSLMNLSEIEDYKRKLQSNRLAV